MSEHVWKAYSSQWPRGRKANRPDSKMSQCVGMHGGISASFLSLNTSTSVQGRARKCDDGCVCVCVKQNLLLAILHNVCRTETLDHGYHFYLSRTIRLLCIPLPPCRFLHIWEEEMERVSRREEANLTYKQKNKTQMINLFLSNYSWSTTGAFRGCTSL